MKSALRQQKPSRNGLKEKLLSGLFFVKRRHLHEQVRQGHEVAFDILVKG
jgi:hypothetical protein